jgi:hypothetical protein
LDFFSDIIRDLHRLKTFGGQPGHNQSMKEKRFFHDIPDSPLTAKTGASRDVMPLLGNPSTVSLHARTSASGFASRLFE